MLFSRRVAFTLLEVCLAVFIAMLILTLAVPSIQGVVNDAKMRKRFDEIDALARDAQSRSVTERRAFVLAWDKAGIALRPQEPRTKEEAGGISRVDFSEKETVTLGLPAALVKKPAAVWTFWPTGTCEPATLTGEGGEGRWTADYNPLTARAVFSSL